MKPNSFYMLKKIFLALLLAAIVISGLIYFKFFTPTPRFNGERKFLYIYSREANKQAVLDALVKDSMVKNIGDFEWLAGKMNYWERIKPGKYRVNKNETVYDLVKKLRSGDHFPVNLVINKLRLPSDLARIIGRNFEADSASVMAYLKSAGNKSDTSGNDLLFQIIPNTYSIPWTYEPEKIMTKLKKDYNSWWEQKNRLEKAKSLGYTPAQIYILASIVEEETNKAEDKGKVASVYLNRLKLGMPLQADPTIRYALKNFVMNRVLFVHLRTPSPYNTYLNPGLPPGPICTPSPATIDSVLSSPKTDYLFFVADADLMGGSTFTTDYASHTRAAKIYQDSLTAWLKRKAIREKAKQDSLAKATQP